MNDTTTVKICGITSYEDAALALGSGADALGFNFYAASPRCLTAERARDILRRLPGDVWSVGVFVDMPAAEVRALASGLGFRTLQFHGGEDAAYLASLAEWELIKAVRVGGDASPPELTSFDGLVQYFLFDRYSPRAHGGTGAQIESEVLDRVDPQILRRSFLAGGLNPGNVAEKVRRYRPYGVDVASGVESTPGKKSAELVRSFIEAVRGS